MTNIRDFATIFNSPGIEGRKIDSGDIFELVHVSLEASTFLKPHISPFDVKLIVLKGAGIMIIDDTETPCSEGDVITCKGSIPHGMKTTESLMEVLVVKKM